MIFMLLKKHVDPLSSTSMIMFSYTEADSEQQLRLKKQSKVQPVLYSSYIKFLFNPLFRLLGLSSNFLQILHGQLLFSEVNVLPFPFCILFIGIESNCLVLQMLLSGGQMNMHIFVQAINQEVQRLQSRHFCSVQSSPSPTLLSSHRRVHPRFDYNQITLLLQTN